MLRAAIESVRKGDVVMVCGKARRVVGSQPAGQSLVRNTWLLTFVGVDTFLFRKLGAIVDVVSVAEAR